MPWHERDKTSVSNSTYSGEDTVYSSFLYSTPCCPLQANVLGKTLGKGLTNDPAVTASDNESKQKVWSALPSSVTSTGLADRRWVTRNVAAAYHENESCTDVRQRTSLFFRDTTPLSAKTWGGENFWNCVWRHCRICKKRNSKQIKQPSYHSAALFLQDQFKKPHISDKICFLCNNVKHCSSTPTSLKSQWTLLQCLHRPH